MTNYELVKGYFLRNEHDGKFESSINKISKELSISYQNTAKAIKKLEKNNVIRTIRKPSRGRYASALWEVLEADVTADVINEKHTYFDFEGVHMVVYQTEIGNCLIDTDVAKVTIFDIKTMNGIIESNREVFVPNMTVVDGKRLMNKHAIIMYLMMLNIDNCIESHRRVLADFKNNVVANICDATLYGKIVLTESNHIKLLSNIKSLTEVSKEDLITVFTDMEDQLKDISNKFVNQKIQMSSRIGKLEKKVERTENMLKTEKKAKNLLITENRELQSKLLDRTQS